MVEGRHVSVKHPAHVEHASPRGRGPRLSLVSMRTVVEVPTPSPDGFERAFAMAGGEFYKGSRTILARGDGFWEVICNAEGKPIARGEVASYLADDGRGPAVPLPLASRFARTPVVGWDGKDAWMSGGTRGREVRDGSLGEIGADGRPRAAQDLRAWVAGNLAFLADGRCLMRVRPFAHGRVGIDWRRWSLHLRHGRPEWDSLAAAPGTYRELSEAHGLQSSPKAAVEDWLHACERFGIDDPDVDLDFMANAHACPLHDLLARIAARPSIPPETAQSLAPVVSELAPVARRALLGLAGGDDLSASLDVLCRGAAVFSALYQEGVRRAGEHAPLYLDRSLRRHFSPRISALLDARVGADLDDVAGLLPSGH